MSFKAPVWRYEEIGAEAEKFLEEYHPEGSIPIPIDAIVEFQLGLNIIPIYNLYREVRVNGFLTSDLQNIYVDEQQLDQYEQKYRFTLAHEVGHLILHRDVYEQVQWKSLEDFRETYEAIQGQTMGWFETQGNWFAEQVLVPRAELINTAIAVVKENVEQLRPLGKLAESAWSYLANEIAKPFNVSPSVVIYRIRNGDIGKEVQLGDFI